MGTGARHLDLFLLSSLLSHDGRPSTEDRWSRRASRERCFSAQRRPSISSGRNYEYADNDLYSAEQHPEHIPWSSVPPDPLPDILVSDELVARSVVWSCAYSVAVSPGPRVEGKPNPPLYTHDS